MEPVVLCRRHARVFSPKNALRPSLRQLFSPRVPQGCQREKKILPNRHKTHYFLISREYPQPDKKAVNSVKKTDSQTIMKKHVSIFSMRILLTAALVVTLSYGCANLSAIRQFAESASRTAEYTKLVDDYVQCASRQKKYQPENQHERLEQIAKERSGEKGALILRHLLIEEYMDALGQLAADQVVTYDKEIDSLGAAAKQGKFIDDEEAAAFSALGKVLTKAATDGWRQRKLKQLIEKSNEPLQLVISSLKQIVDDGFAGDLKNEEVAVEKYYHAIIADSHDKAGIAALEEWMTTKLETIRKRGKAIETYSEALVKIAEGHKKLYHNRNRVRSKELLGQMSRYAKDLRKAYDTLKDL